MYQPGSTTIIQTDRYYEKLCVELFIKRAGLQSIQHRISHGQAITGKSFKTLHIKHIAGSEGLLSENT